MRVRRILPTLPLAAVALLIAIAGAQQTSGIRVVNAEKGWFAGSRPVARGDRLAANTELTAQDTGDLTLDCGTPGWLSYSCRTGKCRLRACAGRAEGLDIHRVDLPPRTHRSRRGYFARHPLLRSVLTAVGVTVAVQILEFKGYLASSEGKVLDWYFKAAPQPDFSPVVTLEIDDEAYKNAFQDHSPLDASGLLSIVDQVRHASPRVIGVDILTDSDPGSMYPAWVNQFNGNQGANTTLVWAMGELGRAPPGSVGIWTWLKGPPELPIVCPTNVLGDNASILSWPLLWGAPVFPRDEELVLRRYPRETRIAGTVSQKDLDCPADSQKAYTAADTQEHPAWATAVAQAYFDRGGEHRRWRFEKWLGIPGEVLLTFKHKSTPFHVSKIFTADHTKGAELQPLGSPSWAATEKLTGKLRERLQRVLRDLPGHKNDQNRDVPNTKGVFR